MCKAAENRNIFYLYFFQTKLLKNNFFEKKNTT